jgi:DNA-nicking Smr family endonuclease
MGAKKQVSTVNFHPFENLRKIIESKGMTVSPKVRPKEERKISDEEIFTDAMREVREIEEFRKIPFRSRAAVPVKKHRRCDDEAVRAIRELVQGRRPLDLPGTQEYVEWVNPHFKADIVKQLHEGKFSVQDCLDLHGLFLQEAEEEVEGFLDEAIRKRLRCVKIIHGRGLRSPCGPVLKEAVIEWLTRRHWKRIIAFVTARQCDGGLGAVYVLLK